MRKKFKLKSKFFHEDSDDSDTKGPKTVNSLSFAFFLDFELNISPTNVRVKLAISFQVIVTIFSTPNLNISYDMRILNVE